MNKEFEGKKLLVLGGIKLECDIVTVAQSLGAYVVVLDYDLDSPAKLIADEAVLMDATDEKSIIEYCKKAKIDGITTGFVDFLLPVCHNVCKALGLPYYANEKLISMATNKIDFKQTCEKYGLPVPKTYYEGDKIPASVLKNIKYPVFVKPLDASGSRGACTCHNEEELLVKFEEAVSFSKTKTAIIEDLITGREFLLNYFACDGEYRVISMFDRYICDDRRSGVNYSNISLAPSKGLQTYMDTLNEKAIKMFKEIGYTEGIVFIQGFFDKGKITFYEMGCRLGGSYYVLENAVTGYNPVEMCVRYALSGKTVKNIHEIPEDIAQYKKSAAAVNYLLDGEEGTVAKIEGLNVLYSLPTYVSSLLLRPEGTHYSMKDKIYDKPFVCAYLVADNVSLMKESIKELNAVTNVYDENGKYILKAKFNPDLFE